MLEGVQSRTLGTPAPGLGTPGAPGPGTMGLGTMGPGTMGPGAAGTIAAQIVARAPNDGYTMLVSPPAPPTRSRL
jgi:hypothetical protein